VGRLRARGLARKCATVVLLRIGASNREIGRAEMLGDRGRTSCHGMPTLSRSRSLTDFPLHLTARRTWNVSAVCIYEGNPLLYRASRR
jgi:hypothetical protein